MTMRRTVGRKEHGVNDGSGAFFHRPETREMIAKLAGWSGWTIYVGAGGSVDRTGLTWSRLVDELLEDFVADADLRRVVLAQHGEQRAATIACSLYGDDDDSTDRITRKIQELLYGNPGFLAGRMLPFVAGLAVTLWLVGSPVAIVTPNYDSYLLDEIRLQLDPSEAMSPAELATLVRHYVARGANETLEVLEEHLADQAITFVSLHGYIPKRGEAVSPPVVSEADYHRTSDDSTKLLTRLFADRNLLILGSSLTDPPLVSALHQTKRPSTGLSDVDPPRERVAVLPLQGTEWASVPREQMPQAVQLTEQRLETLDVESIFPDFFGQVGQFVHEVTKCIEFGDVDDLRAFTSKRRYGSRLTQWWGDWIAMTQGAAGSQANHHSLLRDVCAEVAEILNTSPSEPLKLEAWVRWQPSENRRELALWASSVGTWPDIQSMRRDTISPDSPYRSVQAFCNGSPTFMSARPGESTRWKTYLAVPVWLARDNGWLQVGVLSLASMREEASASLNRTARGLGAVIKLMNPLGRAIFDPQRRPPAVA